MARRYLVAVLVTFCSVMGVTAPVSAHETYEVRDGDTLSHIAVRFGVSVADLVAENDLPSADRLRVGQRLSIPHGDVATAAVRPATPTPAPTAGSSTYTIEAGDTLSGIALRFGVSQSALADLNNIADPHRIRVGKELRLPATAVTPSGVVGAAEAGGQGGGPVPASDVIARYPNLPTRITSRPERLALVPVFEKWAEANGLPVDLVMAVAWLESGWNNDAVSSAGAVGIGQIMPATGAWIASDLIGQPGLRRENPEDNIRMSARYLRWLIGFMGDEERALAGYFQGPNSVKGGQLLEATERYVASVSAQRRFFVPR